MAPTQLADNNNYKSMKQINALKRSFLATIPTFKSSNNRSDVAVEALVLKRQSSNAPKPGKKAPPTSLRLLILNEDEVTLNAIVEENGSENGTESFPTQMSLTAGKTMWASVFDLPAVVTDGTIILLNNTKCRLYNGQLRVSADSATVKCNVTYEKMVDSFSPKVFLLPDTFNEIENVILPIGVTISDEHGSSVFGCTWSYPRNRADEVYTNTKNQPVIAAYDSTLKGYPLVVRNKKADGKAYDVSVMLKIYDNHLNEFGITDIDAWKEMAGLFFDNFRGVILGYQKPGDSANIDYNRMEMENATYKYAVRITVSKLFLDLPEIIRCIGFEVSYDYVMKDIFENDILLDSDHANGNVLYANRKSGKVICLNEFTGRIETFKEGWKLYAVVNYDSTSVNQEELAKMRSEEVTNEEREAMLSKDLESKFANLNYEILYVYAIRN